MWPFRSWHAWKTIWIYDSAKRVYLEIRLRVMSTTQKVIQQIREYKGLDNFARIKLLISRLTHTEIEIVLAYLNAFGVFFDKKEKDTKTAALLKYLLQSPEATEELAMEHFGINKPNTFDKLVERLKDKIGYCLTSEIITQRQGEYSERYQAIFQINDRLKRFEIYWGKKSLPEEAYGELNKVIQLAKTYDVYSSLIDALYFKLTFLKIRYKSKEYDKLVSEINHYEKCRTAYSKAVIWHNEYIQFADFEGYRAGFAEVFEEALQELQAEYTSTKSASVGYYYHIIKTGYYQELRKFNLAADSALKLLNIVRDNKAVYMPWRMGTAYIHISDTCICQKDFAKSIEAAQMAKKYYTPNSLNYSIAEELEFWAHFYSGEYSKAEEIILQIIANPDYARSSYIDNKRNYLLSCALFIQGKLKECAQVLETVKEIHTDKRGWNIGIRILSLMVTFSQPELEELSIRKLDALRKHLDKLKQLKETRKRDVIIFNILSALLKSGGDFVKVYSNREEDFNLLDSSDTEYGWQIRGHELIVFQAWFRNRMNNKPYHLDLTLASHPSLEVV
jgi:hypothetical protein